MTESSNNNSFRYSKRKNIVLLLIIRMETTKPLMFYLTGFCRPK